MPTTSSPNIETLLGQIGWLRNLARHLAGSTDLADDVVQDTLAVALRSPPDPQRPIRPWLGGVLRHLLQKRCRDEGRRRLGDGRAVADPDAEIGATPEMLAQQAKALRVLAELVCELDETQQKIILLRFFEEQTSEQIGEALGLPAGTVRRQQKETIAHLRDRMNRKHGGRQAWCGLFLLPSRPAAPIISRAKVGFALSCLAVTAVAIVTGAPKGASKPEKRKQLPPPALAIFTEPQPGATTIVTGAVVDDIGRPIAKAAVLLRCTYDCPPGTTDQFTATDAAGLFRFSNVAKTRFTVMASQASHIGASVKIDLTATQSSPPLRLMLGDGGFAIEGTVSDAGGGIIGGAVIVAKLRDQMSFATTTNDGRYQMRLPRGTHIVSVDANGYAALHGQAIESVGDITRNFVLTPAATISGKVTDDDGAAIAGALVMARTEAMPGRPFFASTGADGTFHFGNLPSGRADFSARKGAYWGASEPLPDLQATEIRTNVLIKVSLRPYVKGIVVNHDGEAASECAVRIESGAVSAGFLSGEVIARCKADGSFAVNALPAGRYAIQVRADGYAWSARDFLMTEVSQELKFTLDPEIVLKGSVVTNDGSPVQGAKVELTTRASHAGDAMFTGATSRTTDERGRFEANHLGSGMLRVNVRHDAFGLIELEQSIAEVKMHDLVLRFPPPAFISGKVVWDDGKPAAQVIARWHCGRDAFQSATDRAGAFRIGPVPQGFGELAARSEANGMDRLGGPATAERKRLFIKAGMGLDGIVVTLKRPNKTMGGKVIDERARPVANARIIVGEDHEAERVAWKDSPPGWNTHEATTDADGKFTIPGLVKGTYQAVVVTGQHPNYVLNEVASERRDLLIQLRRSCQMRVRVTTPQGVPLTKFEIKIHPSASAFDPNQGLPWLKSLPLPVFGGAPQTRQWTDSADGTYLFGNLDENVAYDITVQTPDERYGGYARAEASCTQPALVDIAAYQEQTVRGKIVDIDSGQPLADVGVALGNRTDLFATKTNAEGHFELRGVFPGLKEYLNLRAFPLHVPETIAVNVPANGQDIDVGVMGVIALPPQTEPVNSGEAPTMGSVSTGIVLVPGSHPPQVAAVMPNSPASIMGVQAGSVIEAIDARSMMRGAETAANFLLNTPMAPTSTVTLRNPGGAVQVVRLEKVSAEALGLL